MGGLAFPDFALAPQNLFGLKPKIPALPPPPPAPPKPDDPAIAAAAKRQREAELLRKGRSSTIISGGAGITSDAPLSQPQALGA